MQLQSPENQTVLPSGVQGIPFVCLSVAMPESEQKQKSEWVFRCNQIYNLKNLQEFNLIMKKNETREDNISVT